MRRYSVARALAVLCVIWSVRHLISIIGVQDPAVGGFLLWWASAWALFAGFLWLGRWLLPVSLALVAMCAAELLLLDVWADYAIMLIGWLALALAAAPRSPHDQRFAARILLSTVYAFSALSKLQPSWLMGENLHKLVATRPQAAWLEPFLVQPWLSLGAAAVVATELWLAIGLWFPRTRVPTASIGAMMHLTLIVLATVGGVNGLLHLVALNGGLILLYPAFWEPLTPPARPADPQAADASGAGSAQGTS